MSTKIVNVAFFGDSVTGQYQSKAGGGELDSRDGWMHRVNSTGGGKFNCASFGQNGATVQAMYSRFSQVFPLVSNWVDVVSMQIWTPNNSYDLESNYTLIQNDILAVQSLTQSAGKGFIVHFWAPPGALLTSPSGILAWNNLRAWATTTFSGKIVDTVDVISTGTHWNSSYSEDDTHPNAAGSVLIGDTAMPKIKTILTNWGYSV